MIDKFRNGFLILQIKKNKERILIFPYLIIDILY